MSARQDMQKLAGDWKVVAKDQTWIVEMTIRGRVRPVKVTAPDENSAMDAAEAKHPSAERIWNAYTMREWRRILKEEREWKKKQGLPQ